MIARRALAMLAALAALASTPAPTVACSYAPREEAVRVSGEDGRGRRPWFFIRVLIGHEQRMLDMVVLRRVKACRPGRVCPGTAVPLQRAGDYVRPAVELEPGSYQLSTVISEAADGPRVDLATFTVDESGPSAAATTGRVYAFSRLDPQDGCADGTPAVYLVLDEWAARDKELRDRLLLVYDRRPDPRAPLVGVVKVVALDAKILAIRYPGPGERWDIKELPDTLWVVVSDDDGGLSKPIRVGRR